LYVRAHAQDRGCPVRRWQPATGWAPGLVHGAAHYIPAHYRPRHIVGWSKRHKRTAYQPGLNAAACWLTHRPKIESGPAGPRGVLLVAWRNPWFKVWHILTYVEETHAFCLVTLKVMCSTIDVNAG